MGERPPRESFRPGAAHTGMDAIETTDIDVVGGARQALLDHLAANAKARFIRIDVGRG